MNHLEKIDSKVSEMPTASAPKKLTPTACAIERSGKSQREIARETGIPQARISRIASGDLTPKAPELYLLANATGATVRALTESHTIAGRVEYAARASEGSGMEKMRETLISYMELNDYLHDQAIH